jgi:hypothetical protein
MEKEKEYKFKLARGGRGPREYKKLESKLAPNEINLLLGDLIHTFNSMPKIVQISFLQLLTQEMEEKQRPSRAATEEEIQNFINQVDGESNKGQSGETGMESTGLRESETIDRSDDVGKEPLREGQLEEGVQ